MGYGGGGSVVLLGLLPHQLVDHGLFAEATVAMKLVHVGHWRVRGRRCYMAPREKRRTRLWLEQCVYICKFCKIHHREMSVFQCLFM